MELVDTHAHLDFDAFDKDREEMIARAWGAGLVNIITIGSGNGTRSADDAVVLASGEERIFATVGVHPHDADLGVKWKGDPKGEVDRDVREVWEEKKRRILDRMSMLALHPKVVAVGEVGLDFHYDNSPRELQRELFRSFIRLAVLRKLPLVIHSREAEGDTVQILQQEGAQEVGGVIHCFSGRPLLSRAAMELGFSVGIVGVVTYKKARELHQAVGELPQERLVVETDCPYLAPVPYRGKRNEPAYVVETVREIARLRKQEPEEIGRVTTENARRLFGIGELEQKPQGKIVYAWKQALYINITNRCTLACRFCLKTRGHVLGGMDLSLRAEPSAEEVIAALQTELDVRQYPEVVFCGIGEPLLRLDEVKKVCGWLKEQGLRVRVNTDGLASLVSGRDVVPELAGLVDAVSVSLNAPDSKTYARLCPSEFGEQAFEAVCDFIKRSSQALPRTQATAVELEGVDLEETRKLAESLGASFRVRGYK